MDQLKTAVGRLGGELVVKIHLVVEETLLLGLFITYHGQCPLNNVFIICFFLVIQVAILIRPIPSVPLPLQVSLHCPPPTFHSFLAIEENYISNHLARFRQGSMMGQKYVGSFSKRMKITIRQTIWTFSESDSTSSIPPAFQTDLRCQRGTISKLGKVTYFESTFWMIDISDVTLRM